MSAAHMIRRAEAALRTEQPNLAALYMRRATEYAVADRAEHRLATRTAQRAQRSPLQNMAQDVNEAFGQLADGVRAVWRQMMPSLAHLIDQPQSAYTLAGPSLGGTA